MRNLFTILVCAFMGLSAQGQAPQKFSYQSVIRNSSGNLVANSIIGLRVSILSGSASGTIVYMETHLQSSNDNGLVTMEIGSGTAISGSFGSINWGTNSYFLKIETDPTGGTNYSITTTNQMLSVPYALYAASSGSGGGGLPNGTAAGQMLYWNGTAWVNVAPGTNGQQLSFCNGVPTWGNCPGNLATITTTAASNVTNTEASLGGNVTSDGGSAVTSRGICYNTSANPTTANSVVSSGNGTGSFTVNLTNLTANTTYYARAFATNASGTAYGPQETFTTTTGGGGSFVVGQNYGGGIIFYVDGTGQHGLIAAPFDQPPAAWGCAGTFIVGTSSIFGSGQANTTAIVNGCTGNHAARVCDQLTLNGFSDWYMPSSDELRILMTSSSIVGIVSGDYWSSTQTSASNAESFYIGGSYLYTDKNTTYNIRPIRSF